MLGRFRSDHGEVFRCSFCKKAQEEVPSLVSSRDEGRRAYICNECVAVCADILKDDRSPLPEEEQETTGELHPFLFHPRASELMEAVVHWMREESLGKDGSLALAEVRTTAAAMLAGG